MDDVVVLEVEQPSVPEVVFVGPDASPTPVYVPGSGSGGSGLPAVFVSRHEQGVPQSVWVVNHSSGDPVSWVLRDSFDRLCWNYNVEPLTSTQTRISMDEPTAGSITLIIRRL